MNTDWPDLDAIRVGEDFYMVASSLNRVPGLPILRSRDLVSWSLVAHAAPALEPAGHYSLPRHGSGVWAPAIRHHGGVFYIFVPDPDYGISVLTALDPAGPWSSPRMLMPGLGLIDPCPLWDADGRAWMVFAWAKSRSGVANRLSIVEITPDASAVLGPAQTVVDGDAIPGCTTLEGPKLYQRDGFYWIFAPAGGVANGWQMAFRSRSLLGPYEGRTVLETGETVVNGPHQGAWVDTPHGEDWFLHFQDRGVFGRVTHLQPMTWDIDGWPVLGNNGEPVLEHAVPFPDSSTGGGEDQKSESWTAAVPGLQWHWQANPVSDWISLKGDGCAAMLAVPNDLGSLRGVPQVLGQQLPGTASTFTTSLRIPSVETGSEQQGRAGVVVLGRTYAWIGLSWRNGEGPLLVAGTHGGNGDENTSELGPVRPNEEIALRIRADNKGICLLEYRRENEVWQPGVENFQATAGQWISAEVGLFSCSNLGTPSETVAVFGPVKVVVQ